MTVSTPSQKPPIPFPRLAGLTVAIAAIVTLLRVWLIEPSTPAITPKGLAALPFAVVFAFGLSVVITLAYSNRHRWGTVLRRSTGRVVGAVTLAFLTPLFVYDWLPWIFGALLALGGAASLGDGDLSLLPIAFAASITAIALWYPISGLIVSGLASRWARVAVFCLMFWTAYSAIILVVGNRTFRL
jgi:hypothetical protein